MKNQMIIAILVIITVSVAIGVYLQITKIKTKEYTNDQIMVSDSMVVEDNSVDTKDDQDVILKQDSLSPTESDSSRSPARYINYSLANYEQLANTKRILFFYANWCPECKLADTSFRQNEDKIPSNVTLVRVNYNDTDTDAQEKNLAEKYSITYQHTFVQIDSKGNEVNKWNGGKIDELLTNIK